MTADDEILKMLEISEEEVQSGDELDDDFVLSAQGAAAAADEDEKAHDKQAPPCSVQYANAADSGGLVAP